MDNATKKIFISYAREDSDMAQRVRAAFDSFGIQCWIDEQNIRAGNYRTKISKAIQKADGVVLLISSHSNGSDFVESEISLADDNKKPLYPIRVEDVNPKASLALVLSKFNWIDSWDPQFDEKLKGVASVILETDPESLPSIRISRTSPYRIPVAKTAAIWALTIVCIAAAFFAWEYATKDELTSPILTQAIESLNQNDFTAAMGQFETVLEKTPDNQRALLGLGYAHILAGDLNEAKNFFDQLTDAGMMAETDAFQEYLVNGPEAQTKLRDAQNFPKGQYAAVLLSKMDIADAESKQEVSPEDYKQAAARLIGLNLGGFQFEWQFAKMLKTRAHAEYKSDDTAKAEMTLDELQQLQGDKKSQFVRVYNDMIKVRTNIEEHEAIRQSIRDIIENERIVDSDSNRDYDGWTSTPLVIWISEADVVNIRHALEPGLSDIFPLLLRYALRSFGDNKVQASDQGKLMNVLTAQGLNVFNAEDAKLLREFDGVRCTLKPTFYKISAGRGTLLFEITDHVKMTPIHAESMSLGGIIGEEIVPLAAARIRDSILEACPIRARLDGDANGEWRLNIGSNVGLVVGDEFTAYAALDESTPVQPITTAGSVASVAEKYAIVKVDPVFEDAKMPSGGWYVEF